MKALRIILFILGLFLAIDSFVMAIISNFTTGIVIIFMLGISLILIGIFFDKFRRLTSSGIFRALKWVIACVLVFSVGMCGFLFVYGNNTTAAHKEDVIMVLGCGINGDKPTKPLAARLDAAISEHEKNPSAYILVSGGMGIQEDISEAEAMKRYLVSKEISEDKIIMEDKSTSTSENFKYSKEILDNMFDDYSVAFVTNDFHLYRAQCLARLAGFDKTSRVHAPIPWSSVPMMYSREVLGVLKMWLFKY